MTEEQRAELEKLARNAEFKRSDFDTAMEDQIKFNRAANPATVLDLLATIARLEAEKVKDGEAISFYITEHDRAVAALVKDGMPRSVGADDETISALRARLSSRAKDQSQ